MIQSQVAIATVCVVLGLLTAVELTRAYFLLKRWRGEELDPSTPPLVLWLAPWKIALGSLGVGAGLFDPTGLGLYALAAGALLIASVAITRSPALLRYKPVRMVRGFRIVAGLFALLHGVRYFFIHF